MYQDTPERNCSAERKKYICVLYKESIYYLSDQKCVKSDGLLSVIYGKKPQGFNRLTLMQKGRLRMNLIDI